MNTQDRDIMSVCAICEFEHRDDKHGARTDEGFTDSRSGLFFCPACTESLLSWEYDGCPDDSDPAYASFVWASRAVLEGDPV